MKFDPNNVPEEMRSGPMCIGRRYAMDVMNIDTLPTIARYTGKVLILHGDKDTLVDISGSQKAAEAYEAAGADVSLQIIPNGKHIFLKSKHIKMANTFIKDFVRQLPKNKDNGKSNLTQHIWNNKLKKLIRN